MFKTEVVLLLLWACSWSSTEAVGVAIQVAAGGQAGRIMRSQADPEMAAFTPSESVVNAAAAAAAAAATTGTATPAPAAAESATTVAPAATPAVETTAAAAPDAAATAAPAAKTSASPAPAKSNLKIFIYELPKSLNSDLVACYKSFALMNVWEDFREEKGQNSADIWVHKLLEKHGSRTKDPDEADVFYIPFYGFLSSFFSGYPAESEAGPSFSAQQGCSNKGHIHRIFELSDFLDASTHFKTKPERHVMTVSFWSVARKSLEPMKAPPSVVMGPLFDKLQHSTLLVLEPLFSSMVEANEYKKYSGKLITIPYVAKPSLTDRLSSSLGHREISFFFQGSIHVDSTKGSQSLASRQQLAKAFEGVPGALIKDTMKHYTGNSYEIGMTHASFCLVLEGDTPTSARLFDALAAGCVPLVLSDAISLPFSKQLDWTTFSVHPQEGAYKARTDPAALIAKDGTEHGKYRLGIDAMRSMPNEKLASLQEELQKVRESFIYGHGTPEKFTAGGAIEFIITEIQSVMNDVKPSTAQKTIDQLNKDFAKILPAEQSKKL